MPAIPTAQPAPRALAQADEQRDAGRLPAQLPAIVAAVIASSPSTASAVSADDRQPSRAVVTRVELKEPLVESSELYDLLVESVETMAASVASSPSTATAFSNEMFPRSGERTTSVPRDRGLSNTGDASPGLLGGHGSASSQTSIVERRATSDVIWEMRFALAAEGSFFGGESRSTNSVCSRGDERRLELCLLAVMCALTTVGTAAGGM